MHVPPPGGKMHTLWDSPAWLNFGQIFPLQMGNLTFGLYVDWFNPFTNKIAGTGSNYDIKYITNKFLQGK
jgi:hypothetical protein